VNRNSASFLTYSATSLNLEEVERRRRLGLVYRLLLKAAQSEGVIHDVTVWLPPTKESASEDEGISDLSLLVDQRAS
jgi:hypothetical protein